MVLTRQQKLALVILGTAIVLSIVIRYVIQHSSVNSDDIVFSESSDSQYQLNPTDNQSAQSPSSTIYVHVSGEVKKPGVYVLKSGARVFQALSAAGGTTKEANTESFNLAAPIPDGTKLYVPAKGEDPMPQESGFSMGNSQAALPPSYSYGQSESFSSRSSGGSSSNKLRNPGDGTVDINASGQAELTRLPGVGPSTAARIIEYRNQIGRFSSPQQLMDVKGIGPKKFAKMQPFIVCR